MLALITGLLLLLIVIDMKGFRTMAQGLGRLRAEVEEIKDRTDAAIAVMAGLAQEIRDNVADEAALNALADELDAEGDKLAAAIDNYIPPAGGQEEPTPENPTGEPVVEQPAPTEETPAEDTAAGGDAFTASTTSRRGRQG